MGLFTSETVIKDDVTLSTDIITEVEEVMDFVRKHINKEVIITEQLQNTERWQYPLECIRELVVNMIVHRDYMSGIHSLVKVFPDSIVFFNSGSLPEQITLQKLLSDDYISFPRNLQVAKMFKDMGLIEQYGTGIKRVPQLFLDHGLSEPEFKLVQGGFFVRIVAGNETSKSSDSDVGVNKLLEVIADNPGLNLSKLKVYFDVTDRTLERWLRELREQRKIEFKGAPRTGGYWSLIHKI